MTKLMEWLLFGFFISGIWLAVNTGETEPEWYYRWFPLILLFVFGLYSVVVVLYRVFTFNNCESAAVELQKEIKEARADLRAKGIQLKTYD